MSAEGCRTVLLRQKLEPIGVEDVNQQGEMHLVGEPALVLAPHGRLCPVESIQSRRRPGDRNASATRSASRRPTGENVDPNQAEARDEAPTP